MPAKSEKYPWQPLEDVQGHARLPRYSEISDWPLAGVPLAQCAVEPHAQNSSTRAVEPRAGAQVRQVRALAAGDALARSRLELATSCHVQPRPGDVLPPCGDTRQGRQGSGSATFKDMHGPAQSQIWGGRVRLHAERATRYPVNFSHIATTNMF